MARSTVALFMVAFLSLFIAFWTGVVGCWKRSPGNITATAILMLVTCEYTLLLIARWRMACSAGVLFIGRSSLNVRR